MANFAEDTSTDGNWTILLGPFSTPWRALCQNVTNTDTAAYFQSGSTAPSTTYGVVGRGVRSVLAGGAGTTMPGTVSLYCGAGEAVYYKRGQATNVSVIAHYDGPAAPGSA